MSILFQIIYITIACHVLSEHADNSINITATSFASQAAGVRTVSINLILNSKVLKMSTHVAESSSIRCYLGSINNSKELPLNQSLKFLNTKYIKPDKELIMVTHGYSDEISEHHEAIITNYMKRYGDAKSYCAFNWKKEASAYIGPLTKPIRNALDVKILLFEYPEVAIIAAKVGKELGGVLAQMKKTDIRLVGHSQGAALFGDTGREVFKITGNKIGEIVGLDPAKPPVERPLDKTCATFVWCLHTLFVGPNEALCHVDFWPNFNCEVQPGCPSNTDVSNNQPLCSHIRSMPLMADAVKDPNSLPATKATNYDKWVKCGCGSDADDVNYIGPNADSSNPGSFYLSTNAASPFGQGSAGMDPANRTCK